MEEPTDYAERAAALPAVVRLHTLARVLPWIGLAVLLATITVSALTQTLWVLVGILGSLLLSVASGVCRNLARARERDAIALWVHRNGNTCDEEIG